MSEKPITEARHPLTENIDIFSPADIVTQLHTCDKEIFRGWENSQGLHNESVENVITHLIQKASEIIQDPEDSLIVLSGCGTSGRLSFITASNFNDQLQRDGYIGVFDYLIAGGDLSLFASQERAEDVPQLGVKDLEQITAGKKHVLLVGITCGLSAPYVAGQIDHALSHPGKFTPVVIGFNTVNSARNIPIEGWDKTFYDVAKKLEAATKTSSAFVLNPIIGPEPITGSSRMKSGTATKILLDTIFSCALHRVKGFKTDPETVLMSYEAIQDKTYSQVESLAKLVKRGGECLSSDGHIYYVSGATLGVMGVLDASECPPTFGAAYDDIRGFIDGGFSSLGNKKDLSQKVPISTEYFIKERIPTLTSRDVIVVLLTDDTENDRDMMEKIRSKGSFVAAIHIGTGKRDLDKSDIYDHIIRVELPWSEITSSLGIDLAMTLRSHFLQISCKWLLNSISTGAHILKGKVYRNRMVDVNVSNSKLYHRAIGIIQECAKTSQSQAEVSLLKAIYQSDTLSSDIKSAPIGQHILKATNQKMRVPIALIIAATKLTIDEARSMLKNCRILRIVISRCLDGHDEFS